MNAALVLAAAVALPSAPALAPVVAAPVMNAQTAIVAAMRDSADGWNRGDLTRFTAIYAGDAVFVTPKGLVRGLAAIRARYAPSFVAGGNRRGRLTFSDTAFRSLDPAHAVLWARWTLTPDRPGAKVASGRTTLVFERQATGWRIVSDHSD